MSTWINVAVVVHVLVAIAIIGLVLLQHGKGADMGSGFGGGASGSLFGATGSANFLSRTTAVLAALFFRLSVEQRARETVRKTDVLDHLQTEHERPPPEHGCKIVVGRAKAEVETTSACVSYAFP